MLMKHTLARLQNMKLTGMAEALTAQLEQPDTGSLSFEERFSLLVDHEWTVRHNKRLARLLRQAKLRVPACPEDIDYQHPRQLDRSVMQRLLTGEWVQYHQNVIITGPTGVGKTYLACALGNAMCRQGISTRYYRVPRLLSDLAISHGDGSYARLLKQLRNVSVLILDDWALVPLAAPEARELLEVIEDRNLLQSTVILSQVPIADWHAMMGDPTVADAIMDRLIHNAHKLPLKGDTLRKKQGAIDLEKALDT